MTSTPSTSEPAAPTIAAWRVLFRMLSGIAALFVFAYWAAAGANRGWTKHQIAEHGVEELTGIPTITYKDHFSPGLEWLGVALFLCVALFAITFIRRKTR